LEKLVDPEHPDGAEAVVRRWTKLYRRKLCSILNKALEQDGKAIQKNPTGSPGNAAA
jgi:hypothetical protein